MDSTSQTEIIAIEAELKNINVELEAIVTIFKEYYKNIACEKQLLDITGVIYSIKNTLHV